MESIPVRHIHTAEATLAGFRIRRLCDTVGDKDMVQPLHRHAFYHILMLEKATGSHTIDFVSHQVNDGMVFLLRPGQVHTITLHAGSTGYIVEFTPDFYASRSKASIARNNTDVYHPDANTFKRLSALLDYAYHEYTTQQEGHHDVILANLEIFFVELSRLIRQDRANQPNGYAQERLAEFSALLEKHITAYKNVSYYTEAMSLSLYQLNAITKSLLGKTSSAVIDEYIILESKRYLLATTNPVSHVAQHLGYDDASYFTRFFKKHTGHSPEAFRQAYR